MQRQRNERARDEHPGVDHPGIEARGGGPCTTDAGIGDARRRDSTSGDAVADPTERERSGAEHAEAAQLCGDHEGAGGDELIIDCDRCRIRGDACRDCVVSVLLGPPPEQRCGETERRAVDALADGGMVPHLRLVPVEPVETGEPGDDGRRAG